MTKNEKQNNNKNFENKRRAPTTMITYECDCELHWPASYVGNFISALALIGDRAHSAAFAISAVTDIKCSQPMTGARIRVCVCHAFQI